MKKVLFSFWTNLASLILLWSAFIASALFCIANDKNPKYFEIGEVLLSGLFILVILHALFQLFLWIRSIVLKEWKQFWALTLLLFIMGVLAAVTYFLVFWAIVFLVGVPTPH